MSDAKTSAVLFWKGLFATMYQLDSTNTAILSVYAGGIMEIETAPTVEVINFTLSLGSNNKVLKLHVNFRVPY